MSIIIGFSVFQTSYICTKFSTDICFISYKSCSNFIILDLSIFLFYSINFNFMYFNAVNCKKKYIIFLSLTLYIMKSISLLIIMCLWSLPYLIFIYLNQLSFVGICMGLSLHLYFSFYLFLQIGSCK